MANVKPRVKAPKSASTKKRCKKKSLTGKKETAVNKTDNIVMRRPSDLKLLTPDEKVQYLLQNGHLLRDKFGIKGKPKSDVRQRNNTVKHSTGKVPMVRERLMTRSGHIKKKNKKDLKLINNILKSELMIDDNNKKRTNRNVKNSSKSPTNNNDTELTDQNSKKGSVDNSRSKLRDARKVLQKGAKKIQLVEKHPSKTKQVTLSNGLVLTLSMFQCDFCSKTFSSKSSIRRHMYIHLNLKPYPCPHCSKKFRHRANMKAHEKRKHTDLIDVPDQYMCHICDKLFLMKENLGLHLASHVKNENAYKCIYCDKKFSYHLLLIQHEKQHLVTGRYQCTLCSMSYECRNRLALHVKSHLKIKDYICQYCGKEFLRMNSMRRHVQICHGGHRIECPICKKNLKGHLTEHMRTHEKRRPHECPECGQCFTQSTQLNVHRRSHSGDRPYNCRICERRFSHSNALMLHIRRHTGEKPFPCALCPLSFSQLPHMKAHMRKIHGQENPYKCIKCDQFFKLKVHLENHTKSCTVGDRELSFEEKIQASVQYEEIEVESVMSLSRMRFLLALLFTMIASKMKLKCLGFNKRPIDDLLIDSLEAMGQTPCLDESLTPLKCLRTNIEMLLNNTVPKEQLEKFQKEKKTTEDILELLTDEKKKNE